MTEHDAGRSPDDNAAERGKTATPDAKMKEPTDTDHPTGTAQAAENAETESPS